MYYKYMMSNAKNSQFKCSRKIELRTDQKVLLCFQSPHKVIESFARWQV